MTDESGRILNVSDAEFVELRHFDKHSVKNLRRGPSGKYLGDFLQILLGLYFEWKI